MKKGRFCTFRGLAHMGAIWDRKKTTPSGKGIVQKHSGRRRTKNRKTG